MKNILIALGISLLLSGPLMAQINGSDDTKLRDLILSDVRQQGLDKDPMVQTAVQAAQDAVLFRAWSQQIFKKFPVTSTLKDSIYKEQVAILGNAEYKIYHVFVTEEKASQILIQKMKESNDWTQLEPKDFFGSEIKYSLNRTDWINLAAVLPDFRQAVKAMQKGGYTAPAIRAQDGWHIVGLIDVRPFKMPSAEKIDKELNVLAERKIIDQYIQTLLPVVKKK